MEDGKDYLRKKYPGGDIQSVLFDGKKPWTNRYRTFPEIAKELNGPISVLDKFYGSDSFATLTHLSHSKQIRFLTGQTQENHKSFMQELKDFQREHVGLEVRLFPDKHELHDRYILSKDTVVIVGHGIKDVGRKESFVILLKDPVGTEIRKTLQDKFEERWKKSPVIQ